MHTRHSRQPRVLPDLRGSTTCSRGRWLRQRNDQRESTEIESPGRLWALNRPTRLSADRRVTLSSLKESALPP